MLKNINDVVRFLFCEVFTILLMVKAGLNIHSIVLGLIIPIAVIVYWSIWMAPKSKFRLNELERMLSECLIFGGTGIITYLTISKPLGILYLVVAIINTTLEHILPAQTN